MEALHLVYLVATSYIRFQWDRLFPRDDTSADHWKLRRVHIYRDSTYDFKDITEWFIPDEDWKRDIQAEFPDWPDWRVEVRYSYKGHKFRMLLRPDDEFTWPLPVTDEIDSHFHCVRAPHGILAASLLPRPGSGAREMDITTRVQKYAGVTRDFHGTLVRVHDMFPMDDHEENAGRFSGIRVISIAPETGLRVRVFDYANNAIVSDSNKKTSSDSTSSSW